MNIFLRYLYSVKFIDVSVDLEKLTQVFNTMLNVLLEIHI